MSLFLGKIHYWLFNKILWFENLEEEIIKIAKSEGLDIEGVKSEIEAKYGAKLEDVYKRQEIYCRLKIYFKIKIKCYYIIFKNI